VGVEINGLEELQRAERRRISGIRRIVSVPAVVADGPQDETARCPGFPTVRGPYVDGLFRKRGVRPRAHDTPIDVNPISEPIDPAGTHTRSTPEVAAARAYCRTPRGAMSPSSPQHNKATFLALRIRILVPLVAFGPHGI
jgi:hypothetical protein